jgi:hypothetical protein
MMDLWRQAITDQFRLETQTDLPAMPSVLIEVRQQYSKEQECAIMEAVHAALREAFKILPGDRNIRLLVHEAHRFECPPFLLA